MFQKEGLHLLEGIEDSKLKGLNVAETHGTSWEIQLMQEDKIQIYSRAASTVNQQGFYPGHYSGLIQQAFFQLFVYVHYFKKKVVVVLFRLDMKMNAFQGILPKPEDESMEKKHLTA